MLTTQIKSAIFALYVLGLGLHPANATCYTNVQNLGYCPGLNDEGCNGADVVGSPHLRPVVMWLMKLC